MLADDELELIILHLEGKTNIGVVNSLSGLCLHPTGDERLLPHLERLLADKTLHIVGIPFEYGEVRWLAAYALRAERAAAGNHEIIKLPQTFYPLTLGQIYDFAEPAGVKVQTNGAKGVLATLQEILDLGLVPLHDLELQP